MKTLNQEQMNHVSGAGSLATGGVDYNNYKDFGEYLSVMKTNKLDPLSPNVPGVQEAYENWCNEMNIDPLRSATINGWSSYKGH